MTTNEPRFRIYICGNIHCKGRGADSIYQRLDDELWRQGLDGSTVDVRMGGCQDHCDYGPNMIVWPGPYRYAQLTPAAVATIVKEHLVGCEPIAAYLATPEMRR